MSRLVEVACASIHDGNGNMIEVFVFSSDNASVTLTRKGLMRKAGINTKLDDINRHRDIGRGHYDRAMAQAQELIQEYGRTYGKKFDTDPHRDGEYIRIPQVVSLDNLHESAEMEGAVKFLFNDAIWHGMMWDLFPDMKEDAEFVKAAAVEAARQTQHYNTWGAW